MARTGRQSTNTSNVLCVIMGGGQGSRLFPLTKERAKPAVPLGGKYRIVDIPISNCINSGYRRIYLLTQFNSTSLHRHISQSYKFDQFTGGFVEILAAQRGLESGTTPPKVLETVAAIRRESQVPVVLYIYFNLIHRVGMERFIADAAKAGVDGLLVLDLPPEESDNYEALMRKAGLCHIYLVAPTTPEDRMELIVKRGAGFIYYVSREGVTGMQTKVADTIGDMVARIRKHTDLPIAVGFGISTPDQAKMVAQNAEAVVVGSAIVNQVAQLGTTSELVPKTSKFVQSLVQAVKE